MVILSVSDVVEKALNRESTRDQFADVDLVLGCGDLPYYYLEFLADALNVPVYFVHGNHDARVELGEKGGKRAPQGAVNLHKQVVFTQGLLIAGLEGALRYREGTHMYTQRQMHLMALQLLWKILWNRLKLKRRLDILITHSPPSGIHDQKDLPHQGFKALRWLIRLAKPRFVFHGHVRPANRTASVSQIGESTLINTYGHRRTKIELDASYEKERGRDGK